MATVGLSSVLMRVSYPFLALLNPSWGAQRNPNQEPGTTHFYKSTEEGTVRVALIFMAGFVSHFVMLWFWPLRKSNYAPYLLGWSKSGEGGGGGAEAILR